MRIEALVRAGVGLRAEGTLVPCDRYVAFVGPNDCGKSQWLESVEHAVSGVAPDTPGWEAPVPGGFAGLVLSFPDVAAVEEVFDGWQEPLDSEPRGEHFEAMLDGRWSWSDAACGSVTEWCSELGAHLDDLGLELLEIALDRPRVLVLSVPSEDRGWADVCWFGVDPGDQRVRDVTERIGQRHGVTLLDRLRETELPQINTMAGPLAAVPLPFRLARSRFTTLRPDSSASRMRRRIQAGYQAIGDDFSVRVNARLPSEVAMRYRLSVAGRQGDLADVSVSFADEIRESVIALEDWAQGWRTWLAVAVELVHAEIAQASLVDVLIFDEPEQHLHPDAERAMARWLASLSSSVLVVVATHSPLFADPPGIPNTVVQLVPSDLPFPEGGTDAERWRHNRRGVRAEVRTAPLRADDELAPALGWTRGELVTLLQTLLFVEGDADAAVLEALLGVELRENGILVTPIHGLRKAPGINESELLRLMPHVRRALLVDNLPEEEIERIRGLSDEELIWLARKDSGEVHFVAKMLVALPPDERKGLRVVSHGADDIIALLDSDLLRNELDKLSKTDRLSGGGTWKEEVGLPRDASRQVEIARRVAQQMAGRGLRAAGLDSIIGRLVLEQDRWR